MWYMQNSKKKAVLYIDQKAYILRNIFSRNRSVDM